MFRLIKVTLFALLTASILSTVFAAGYTVARAGVGGSQLVGAGPQIQSRDPSDPPKQFRLLNEVWNILSTDFVEPKALDADKLGRGAIDGVIAALSDSHTTYIDADNLKAEQSGIRGAYEGIGANVVLVEGVLTVVAPLPGSPAEQAGMRAGDRIVAVNGESTKGMALNDAVNKVKGPRGSQVTLDILRQNETTVRTLQVTRAEIRTNSVRLLRMLPDGVAHIQIAQFAQRTGNELRDVLKDAMNQGAKGIVLDLRNNPGGLLDATVDVAGQFLEGGLAGYQVDRNGKKDSLPIRNRGDVNKLPMVVLANRGSASGSELLTGALQDRNRAPLIGTRTFGKGSVNHLRELSDGSALYVTIGRWLTPNGRQIEGQGLTPDYEVNLIEDDLKNNRDAQMDKALDVLRSKIGSR